MSWTCHVFPNDIMHIIYIYNQNYYIRHAWDISLGILSPPITSWVQLIWLSCALYVPSSNLLIQLSWGSSDTYHYARVKPRIHYIWMWHWILRQHHIESKGGSILKELVFSRSSGWEREEQSFCAFSQSLSSLYRPCLVPREVPGGLQAAFNLH